MDKLRIKPKTEYNSGVEHPEHQSVNTSVAEMYRKYGAGKIDSMPTDPRPEIQDNRSEDEMLNDDHPEPGMAYDVLDAIQDLNRYRQKYESAVADIKATEKQKKAFDGAIATLNDPNASYKATQEALEVLDELEKLGKIKQTRVHD